MSGLNRVHWLAGLMLVLTVAAFGLPLLFPHTTSSCISDPELHQEAVERLRVQIYSINKINPAYLQIIEVRLVNEQPPIEPEGMGVRRTLFGIPVGVAEYKRSDIELNLNTSRLGIVWGSFLLIQALLVRLLVAAVRRAHQT